MNSNHLFEFSVNKETKTVHIVREFSGGLDLVWSAWTKAQLLDQWWAPRPYASRTKHMRFEEGGKRFYAMVSPEGQEHWGLQTFTAISPKTNFKMYSAFSDKDENPSLPGSDWDLHFSEVNGTTKVNIIITNESLERMEKMIEMGFKEGFTMGLNQLDELLLTPEHK